jgi:hypothetical protein
VYQFVSYFIVAKYDETTLFTTKGVLRCEALVANVTANAQIGRFAWPMVIDRWADGSTLERDAHELYCLFDV